MNLIHNYLTSDAGLLLDMVIRIQPVMCTITIFLISNKNCWNTAWVDGEGIECQRSW